MTSRRLEFAVTMTLAAATAGVMLFALSSHADPERRHLSRPDMVPPIMPSVNRSVVDDQIRPASTLGAFTIDTVPSPGIRIGISIFDLQHNYSQGRQVARNPGGDVVHFSWTMMDVIPSSVEYEERFVNYNGWRKSTGSLTGGFNGVSISLGDFARGGYSAIDIDSRNLANVTLAERPEGGFPYSVWHLGFPIEGSSLHLDFELPKPVVMPDEVEMQWPDIAIEQVGPGEDIYHIVSMGFEDAGGGYPFPSNRIWYYRYDEGGLPPKWEGPVLLDSCEWTDGVTIDAKDDSGKVAIAFVSRYATDGLNGVFNLCYRQSNTSGAGWLSGAELGEARKYFATQLNDPAGPQLWGETSIAYDHSGVLHLLYLELDSTGTERMRLKHWSNATGTSSTIVEALYENPYTWYYSRNLTHISIGVGDGGTNCLSYPSTNRDCLYVLYSKLGGETPEERADHSLLGRANAELYLTGSYDRGFSWAPPTNLTNTKTPHCSGSDSANVCASEAWATIGRDVSDIEIFYIRDFEADYYYRTSWTINDAMYLSFPGGTTDADFVCPLYAPLMLTALSVSPDCEYHAPGGGSAHETLTLTNNGNAPLEGEITVTAGAVWLSTLPSGPYQVSGGRNDFAIDLNLSAAALAEGLYAGEIQITHNDTTQPSPLVVPVDFFVVDDFHCPEGAIVKTGVNGNSVLSLETRSDGRIGAPDFYGGLWRDEGHSRAIFDASLLVAHGNQTPDTIVYHRFYRESDPGQYGLKALGDLVIDTADYSTGAGFAHATVQMTTADSSLGVDVIWSFPQRPDSANFVIAKYRLSNRTETTISDIALGVIADFNVAGSAGNVDGYRPPESDFGYYHSPYNLLYQYGRPVQYAWQWSRSPSRYSAGITYIAGRDYAGTGLPFDRTAIPLRGRVGSKADDFGELGLTSQQFYQALIGSPGVDVFPSVNGNANLYTVMTLDQGLTLDPGASQTYVMALVSDTGEHYAYGPDSLIPGLSSLDATVQMAWQWAADHADCFCPCHGDPVCDGAINVLDAVLTINVAFRDWTEETDFECTVTRTDVTCDGNTNILDVVTMVDVTFRGKDPKLAICDPCAGGGAR